MLTRVYFSWVDKLTQPIGGYFMNGLRYIRERCNMTASELSLKLGVTRQSISMWEQGKKNIPQARLEQLSIIFGVSEEYFGEISDKQIAELKNKKVYSAFFTKELYEKLTIDIEPKHNVVFEEEYDFDDYVKVQKNKVDLLKEIDESFAGDYGKGIIGLQDQILKMQRYIELYTQFTKLIKSADKFSKSHMIFEVLKALGIALNTIDKNDLIMEQDEHNHYTDVWSLELSKTLLNEIETIEEDNRNSIKRNSKCTDTN